MAHADRRAVAETSEDGEAGQRIQAQNLFQILSSIKEDLESFLMAAT